MSSKGLESTAGRRSRPLRRVAPYNEWGKEGKSAPTVSNWGLPGGRPAPASESTLGESADAFRGDRRNLGHQQRLRGVMQIKILLKRNLNYFIVDIYFF
jgi:hypothetical protein